MQKYPSMKKGMLGWRRLEGDDVPKKQIWMVFDEESDMFANNSKDENCEDYGKLSTPDRRTDWDSEDMVDMREATDGLHTYKDSFQERINYSSSSSKSNLNSSKAKKEFNLHSIYDFHSEDSDDDIFKDRFKSRSKYKFDSEDTDADDFGNFGGQLKTYSRKYRFSELLKNKLSSNNNNEKDTMHGNKQSKKKKILRKKLKVVYPKPQNYMHDIYNENLKDKKNQTNYTKRNLFNPKGDLIDIEEKGHRTSSRKRKTVNYSECQVEQHSESGSDYEEESGSESEDEKRNEIKKKTESHTTAKPQLSAYEQMVERNKEANRRMLEEMGIFNAKTELEESKARNKSKEPKVGSSLCDITNKGFYNKQRKNKKRKWIISSNDIENRTSSRKRKIVNYAETQNYDSSDNENEDENGNVIKKECPIVEEKEENKPQLSAYEQMVERNKEANRRLLEEMGIFQLKTEIVLPKIRENKTREKYVTNLNEIRRSHRLKEKSHT